MSSPPLEVRQCLVDGHYLYGAVAVNAGTNNWGIMDPNRGGHWGTDDEVSDWTIQVSTSNKEKINGKGESKVE